MGVSELWEKFGARSSKRGRFFNTWVEPIVDDGVLIGDMDSVEMAPDWSEALERVREATDEEKDNRLQDARYVKQREAFRSVKDTPTDPTPELAGPERVADIVARADERDREARIEEQRRKVGMTAEVFLDDTLQGVSGFGWRELRALWMAKGGKPDHLRFAVKDPYGFRRYYDAGPLYVERVTPAASTPEHEPAPVRVLRDPNPKMPEKGPDGIYHHGPFCDCDWCDTPLKPRYARPRGGA